MAEELSSKLVTKKTSDFEQKEREARRIKERQQLARDEAQVAEKLRQDKIAEEMAAERTKGMEDILSSPPETREAGVEEAIAGEAVSAGEPEAPPAPADVAPEEAAEESAEDAVARTSAMFGPSGPVEKMTLQQLRQRARAAKRPVRQLMRTATQENMPVIKDLAEKAVEAKKDVTEMQTAKRVIRRAMRGRGMPNVFDAAKAAMALRGAEDAAGADAPAEAPVAPEAASGELPTEFGSGEYNYVQTSPTSVDIYRRGKKIATSTEGDEYYAAIQRERGQELFQGAGGPDRPDTGSEEYAQYMQEAGPQGWPESEEQFSEAPVPRGEEASAETPAGASNADLELQIIHLSPRLRRAGMDPQGLIAQAVPGLSARQRERLGGIILGGRSASFRPDVDIPPGVGPADYFREAARLMRDSDAFHDTRETESDFAQNRETINYLSQPSDRARDLYLQTIPPERAQAVLDELPQLEGRVEEFRQMREELGPYMTEKPGFRTKDILTGDNFKTVLNQRLGVPPASPIE